MIASTVVLSTLVAVCAGQFYGMHISGLPLDSPEVAHAKMAHAIQWNHEAARNMMGRKRREAPNDAVALTSEHDTNLEEKDQHKRYSVYGYSGYGYPGYGYGYGGYGLGYGLGRAYYGRKRRDTTGVEASAKHETNLEEKDQHKRQLFYSSYGYPGVGWAYGGYNYGLGRAFYGRKRRDTTEVEASADSVDENTPVKRQILAGYGYPYGYAGYYPGYPGYLGYIRKRSTSDRNSQDEQNLSQMSSGQIQEQSQQSQEQSQQSQQTQEQRSKRQLLYGSYMSPMMMDYRMMGMMY